MDIGDTRAHIRAVAQELFTLRGYEKTSLREIADRVGVTKASLYYHYPSKQALLLAIVEPMVDEVRHVVAGTRSRPHTPEQVTEVLVHLLETMLRHRSAAAMFLRDAPAVLAAVHPLLDELLRLNAALYTWLAGPDPAPADRIRAMAAVETLGVALGSSAMLPDIDEDELRRTLLDAALAVLRPPTDH